MKKSKNFGKSKKEVKQEIIEYLDANFLCVLATCYDNIPKATPVGYRNEGLTLWISCDTKEGRKVKDVMVNPNVSVAIFNQYEKGDFGWDTTVGITYRGKAQVITRESDERQFMEHEKKKGIREAFKQYGKENLIRDFGENYEDVLLNRMAVIKVEPEEVYFMNHAKQRMYILTWTKD